MEHDMLPGLASHENLLFLEQSFFLTAPSCFSPREGACSPRAFLAAYAPNLAYMPESVDYDSASSVGSRRCSDEFSDASRQQLPEWRLNAMSEHLNMKRAALNVARLQVEKKEEGKLFPCKEPGCRKVYTTTEGLRLHNRNIHMNDKKHKCHIDGCDRAFVRASDLKLHILRIHETERPFPCTEPECNKSFACNSELTRHLNCHNRSRSSRKKLRKTSDDEEDDE